MAIIGTVIKKTQRNATENYGLEISSEKVFLLSRAEVYCDTERNADGADGVPYSYYKDNSDLNSASPGADSNRIKYYNNVARYWVLRTPDATTSYKYRLINTSGGLSSLGGKNPNNMFLPAVVIY